MNIGIAIPRQLVILKGNQFLCTGEQPEQRRIQVNGIPYPSLKRLLEDYPILLNQLQELAILVNFILVGDTYRVIKEISSYKREYHGEYNVNDMHPPKIVDRRFIYYVTNEVNDIPYRASCLYPLSDVLSDASYELLPRK